MSAEDARGPGKGMRVLVVEDEATLARTLVRLLQARGFVAESAGDGAEAIEAAERFGPGVVLLDLRLPDRSGLEVMAELRGASPEVEVVLMTAYGDVDTAVAAVRAGAYDFLTKPFASLDAVVLSVAQAAERRSLLDRTRQLERALEQRESFGELVGSSQPMREVFRMVEGVAASNSTVLLLGESGTGKELVARALHQRSTRASRPLVVVNCGALPADLVESELFGHLRGAFSGATATREGLLEVAHQGTIFLDEIGDLPLPAQVKLLRALQSGEVRRVGANEPRLVDVRVLAATNVDLRARVSEGRFREDLYYRLAVIPIVLPPLRERREDIPALALHLARKHAGRTGRAVRSVAPEALQWLLEQPWQGNVRELENTMERAVVLARGAEVTLPDVRPPGLPEGTGRRSALPRSATAELSSELLERPYSEARLAAVSAFERAYVEALLARSGGNLALAAKTAGLDRSNFKRVLRRARLPAEAPRQLPGRRKGSKAPGRG